ncbi:hypothetical protein [Actinomycetospora atypica]|uniref:Uncharacterized protein n=1 Tax=Actinomycetospora atypica TaxID=1290095 RepID=A0ABV9YI03_9PSEU
MTMIGSPWDVELGLDATDTGAPRPAWSDRVVDLRVLSLHGDDDATLEMARWSADDPLVAALTAQLDDAHRTTISS